MKNESVFLETILFLIPHFIKRLSARSLCLFVYISHKIGFLTELFPVTFHGFTKFPPTVKITVENSENSCYFGVSFFHYES